MLSVRNLARRLAGLVTSKPPPPLSPRPPSTASFQTLDPARPIEEETLPMYNPQSFYPVQIGEVFQSRYQVVGKLGYGAYSTVWLCRDLVGHRYVTVKVCTRNAIPVKRELAALQHLNGLPRTRHAGRLLVRTLLYQFELAQPEEKPRLAPPDSQSTHPVSESRSQPRAFQCLVHKPLLTSLSTFRNGRKLPEDFVQAVLQHVLLALDYLHSEARLVHTDIQESNILLDLDHTPALDAFEEAERTTPTARKVVVSESQGDSERGRTVYLSRRIATESENYGRPVLCDFGEARFGTGDGSMGTGKGTRPGTYTGDIQPYQYRAPEVILGAPWDEKVDIWAVGVMIWDMFEGKNMFKTTGGAGPEKKKRDDMYHLAHMVALLGPPPVDLLQRSTTDTPWRYFDTQGNWTGATSLPNDSLEQSEENLSEGEDKALFLAFVRKMVRWRPEERCSAKELLRDPWLNKLEGS